MKKRTVWNTSTERISNLDNWSFWYRTGITIMHWLITLRTSRNYTPSSPKSTRIFMPTLCIVLLLQLQLVVQCPSLATAIPTWTSSRLTYLTRTWSQKSCLCRWIKSLHCAKMKSPFHSTPSPISFHPPWTNSLTILAFKCPQWTDSSQSLEN